MGINSTIGGLDFRIPVPNPKEKEFETLGHNVMQLYFEAYPSVVDKINKMQQQALLKALVKIFYEELNPVPRIFVRSMLEFLDLYLNGTSARELSK